LHLKPKGSTGNLGIVNIERMMSRIFGEIPKMWIKFHVN